MHRIIAGFEPKRTRQIMAQLELATATEDAVSHDAEVERTGLSRLPVAVLLVTVLVLASIAFMTKETKVVEEARASEEAELAEREGLADEAKSEV